MNDNQELLHTMIEAGILNNLVDILSTGDCDSDTLVCLIFLHVIVSNYRLLPRQQFGTFMIILLYYAYSLFFNRSLGN